MYFDNTEQLKDKLVYHSNKDDHYWACEGLVFELFFSADEDGPDQKQLDAYFDFQQESIEYIDKIRDKVVDIFERKKGQAPARFYWEVPMVDVVNINETGADATMDIVLSFRTFKFLFYSRWKTYVAKFKNRELISLEESTLIEQNT